MAALFHEREKLSCHSYAHTETGTYRNYLELGDFSVNIIADLCSQVTIN